MIKPKKISWGFIVLIAMATGACMPLTSHRLNAPPIEPVPAEIAAVSEEGSIWSVSTAANLFTDLKASKVNDIVTINIVETSTASNNATTSLDRQSGLKAGWSRDPGGLPTIGHDQGIGEFATRLISGTSLTAREPPPTHPN